MASITIEQIEAAYQLGIEVYKSNLTYKLGRETLAKQTGMNPNSAGDYVWNVGSLLRGERYARTFSYAAAEVFLSSIRRDFDTNKIRNAVNAIRLHVEYYFQKTGFKNVKLLALAAQFESENYPPLIESLTLILETETKAAKQLETNELEKRASRASGRPPKVTITVSVFQRDPYVRAFVERRAAGNCDHCKSVAPFQREDQSPYLEVHHRIPLAEGGDDTIENAIALCPNCHREAHFGSEWQKFRTISP